MSRVRHLNVSNVRITYRFANDRSRLIHREISLPMQFLGRTACKIASLKTLGGICANIFRRDPGNGIVPTHSAWQSSVFDQFVTQDQAVTFCCGVSTSRSSVQFLNRQVTRTYRKKK